MYRKSDKIVGKGIQSLSNYIQGFDVYNSLFLSYISNPDLTKLPYEITVYEYRPDLIAKDFYGSEDYMGILIIQASMSLSGFTKGTVLSLLPKETIDNIIDSI